MTTFFTSDLHIDHKNICKYTNRKDCTDTEHHQEWIIDIWNSQVSKSDIVYHLGDFMFSGKYDNVCDIISQLNGTKMFILGNHCKSSVWSKIRDNRQTDKRLSSVGVVDKIITRHFNTDFGKQMFVMCHFPFAVWWDQHYGSIHLHGHSHGSFQQEGRCLDVGIDNAYNEFREHRLYELNEVTEIMLDIEVVSNDYHKAD